MGKTIMNVAAVSLDGFIADDTDGIEPLFDWLGNGDVAWSFPGSDGESRTTQASADFMLDLYGCWTCTATWLRMSSDGGCST